MPLARNTVKDRLLEIAKKYKLAAKIYIKSSGLFALCLDDSTDITINLN